MIKTILLRKLAYALAGLFILKKRSFFLHKAFFLLALRTFNVLGSKYPKLSFLKTQ
jgi:hypothetical protein